jgi:glycosyltransferase involved in cell wall biosynthesis
VIKPVVTIAIPSYNQGRFLDSALSSVFASDVAVEVFVLDGGSTDSSIDVIKKWEPRLSGWRSAVDAGQSSAINEGIARGTAPYVTWLNSDDLYLPNGLAELTNAIASEPMTPAVYGKAWNLDDVSGRRYPVWVESFSEGRLANRCIVSQPACIIRRSAWEMVRGLDTTLEMAMDYDLWWRLFKKLGPLTFLNEFVAVNRVHDATKTQNNRTLHYHEAMNVVRKHYGSIPLKWYLAQPYSVWFKALRTRVRSPK